MHTALQGFEVNVAHTANNNYYYFLVVVVGCVGCFGKLNTKVVGNLSRLGLWLVAHSVVRDKRQRGYYVVLCYARSTQFDKRTSLYKSQIDQSSLLGFSLLKMSSRSNSGVSHAHTFTMSIGKPIARLTHSLILSGQNRCQIISPIGITSIMRLR